jgi:hypothetical protein
MVYGLDALGKCVSNNADSEEYLYLLPFPSRESLIQEYTPPMSDIRDSARIGEKKGLEKPFALK